MIICKFVRNLPINSSTKETSSIMRSRKKNVRKKIEFQCKYFSCAFGHDGGEKVAETTCRTHSADCSGSGEPTTLLTLIRHTSFVHRVTWNIRERRKKLKLRANTRSTVWIIIATAVSCLPTSRKTRKFKHTFRRRIKHFSLLLFLKWGLLQRT